MALKEPESMEEIVYFTRREIDNGKIMAWVSKEKCTKCNKAMMGKPRDKNGKAQIRAKEYTCPECGYTVEKKEYEESLTASIKYTCPHCSFEGEIQVPFKRKSVKGVQTLRFQCGKCSKDIDVTKKMKAMKK